MDISIINGHISPGKIPCRELVVRGQAHFHSNDENVNPNSQSRLPETEDAKSERIRQLHLTLGALIDERDELQDTLSKSTSPGLAQQLQDAQAELHVLRRYAGSRTSGTRSLAELDAASY